MGHSVHFRNEGRLVSLAQTRFSHRLITVFWPCMCRNRLACAANRWINVHLQRRMRRTARKSPGIFPWRQPHAGSTIKKLRTLPKLFTVTLIDTPVLYSQVLAAIAVPWTPNPRRARTRRRSIPTCRRKPVGRSMAPRHRDRDLGHALSRSTTETVRADVAESGLRIRRKTTAADRLAASRRVRIDQGDIRTEVYRKMATGIRRTTGANVDIIDCDIVGANAAYRDGRMLVARCLAEQSCS